MGLKEQLLDIERQLWTNDPIEYSARLLDDALLLFSETGVITKDVAIKEIRRENAEGRRWAEVEMTDVRCSSPAADTGLLAYHVRARWNHSASSYVALAGSVYVRRDGAWKLAFHQQTPLPAARDS